MNKDYLLGFVFGMTFGTILTITNNYLFGKILIDKTFRELSQRNEKSNKYLEDAQKSLE